MAPFVCMAGSPGQGHINPLLCLAQQCSQRWPVVLILPSNKNLSLPRVPDGCAIRIVILNLPEPRSADDVVAAFRWPFDNRTDLVPSLAKQLTALPPPYDGKPFCGIFDMFASWFTDVCAALQIPSIIFHPSPAFFALAQLSYHRWMSLPAASSSLAQEVSGLPNAKSADLPWEFVTKADYRSVTLEAVSEWHKADGMIINDVTSWFSPATLHAMETLPPHNHPDPSNWKAVLVGPLIRREKATATPPVLGSSETINESRDSVLLWLDCHPPRSVIYVSFGTIFTLPPARLKELAMALREVGRPFLWSYKPRFGEMRISVEDAGETESNIFDPDGLPRSFRESVAGFGRIEPWVNQKAVLQNPAIGLFLSHAGWNSVLEAMAGGPVPILTIPFDADQRMIAHFLEAQLGSSVRLCQRALDRTEPFQSDYLRDGILAAMSNIGLSEAAERAHQQIKRAISAEGSALLSYIERFA